MENLLMEMNKLVGGYDVEADHSNADNLLVDAIELLSENLSDNDKLVVSELVSAYRNVSKQYA